MVLLILSHCNSAHFPPIFSASFTYSGSCQLPTSLQIRLQNSHLHPVPISAQGQALRPLLC